MMRWWAIVAAILLAAPGAAANPNFLEREMAGAHVGLALNHLQSAIEAEGFTVLRVQNVDKGLAAKGFERPPYKIVFFANRAAFERAREIDPRVTPYLPLKITVYRDREGNTHLSVVDPAVVGRMFNPGLQPHFARWSQDLERILDRTREAVAAGTW